MFAVRHIPSPPSRRFNTLEQHLEGNSSFVNALRTCAHRYKNTRKTKHAPPYCWAEKHANIRTLRCLWGTVCIRQNRRTAKKWQHATWMEKMWKREQVKRKTPNDKNGKEAENQLKKKKHRTSGDKKKAQDRLLKAMYHKCRKSGEGVKCHRDTEARKCSRGGERNGRNEFHFGRRCWWSGFFYGSLAVSSKAIGRKRNKKGERSCTNSDYAAPSEPRIWK